MIDVLGNHRGLEIRIAQDGRVWINGADGCILRAGRPAKPADLVVINEFTPPKILVEVAGGVVQNVEANCNAVVHIIDHDNTVVGGDDGYDDPWVCTGAWDGTRPVVDDAV